MMGNNSWQRLVKQALVDDEGQQLRHFVDNHTLGADPQPSGCFTRHAVCQAVIACDIAHPHYRQKEMLTNSPSHRGEQPSHYLCAPYCGVRRLFLFWNTSKHAIGPGA